MKNLTWAEAIFEVRAAKKPVAKVLPKKKKVRTEPSINQLMSGTSELHDPKLYYKKAKAFAEADKKLHSKSKMERKGEGNYERMTYRVEDLAQPLQDHHYMMRNHHTALAKILKPIRPELAEAHRKIADAYSDAFDAVGYE